MSDKRRVGVVIPIWKDRVLILKRSPESPSPNKWNFPGGSIEEGEAVPEGAARELYEESGLEKDLEELRYLGHKEVRSLNLYFYAAYFENPEVEINRESTEYKWVNLDEIMEHDFVGGKGISEAAKNAILRAMEARSE